MYIREVNISYNHIIAGAVAFLSLLPIADCQLPIAFVADTITSPQMAGDSLETTDSASIPEQVQLIEDDSILQTIDSIIIVKYSDSLHFTTDTAILNVYDFTPDSVPVYDSSVYASRLSHLDAQTPFSLIYNDRVHAFIQVYALNRREQVSRMLGLAELYFPIFEDILDRYDMPLELKYLAIAESALNPAARSRAGATGLWQFMYSTGKLYGLDITSYIDERRDPYKSTVAACEYLKFLYKIYNDWDLAMAAYNSGPGRVNRAIRRSGGKRNYWDLWSHLPPETRGYVPAFIAVNYIMNYASEHNIYPISPKFLSYETDTVKVTQEVSFAQISAVLNIPVEDIEYLNPVYTKGIIPYFDGSDYTLCLPANKTGDFINNEMAIYNYKTPEEVRQDSIAAIESIELAKSQDTGTPQAESKSAISTTTAKVPVEAKDSKKYVFHIIQPGDTLWDIAKQYEGVTVQQIKLLNNINNVKKLKPGMKIKIAVTSS